MLSPSRRTSGGRSGSRAAGGIANVVLALCVGAPVALVAAPAPPPVVAPAPTLVAATAEAVAPRLKELGRPVAVWHYARRERMGLPEAGYLPPDDPRVAPYLAAKVERYRDRSVPIRPHGTVSGLWLGIDPVICRTFGGVGNGWAVAQVTLPGGVRFLDLRRPGGEARRDHVLPSAVRRGMTDAGCPVASAHALFTSLEHAPCRELALAVVDHLAVGALLVEFPALRFHECSAERDGAFILLRSELVQPERLKLMTRESAADEALADRRRIRELYRRALSAGSERKPPWDALGGDPASPAFEKWMTEHLVGCGGYPEDRIPEEPTSRLDEAGVAR